MQAHDNRRLHGKHFQIHDLGCRRMNPSQTSPHPLHACAGTSFAEDPHTHHYTAQTDSTPSLLNLSILHLLSYHGNENAYVISFFVENPTSKE